MSSTPTAAVPTARHDAARPSGDGDRLVDRPAAVLVTCLAGSAAVVADAWSGEGELGLVGVAVMALALALTLGQAVRARVGRPWRTSRRAAVTGTAACLSVAAFLAAVGPLERMGPQVTGSAAFAAGVAVMSVTLLVVLPLSLLVFGWGVSRDARLSGPLRVLPWAVVVVVAADAAAMAVSAGTAELWLHAAGVAVAGALLTSLSSGLSRVARGSGPASPSVAGQLLPGPGRGRRTG